MPLPITSVSPVIVPVACISPFTVNVPVVILILGVTTVNVSSAFTLNVKLPECEPKTIFALLSIANNLFLGKNPLVNKPLVELCHPSV